VAAQVGIDLGRDRCCVAAIKASGEPGVVLNRANERTTLSAVLRVNGEWLVGAQALEGCARHPHGFVPDPVAALCVGSPLSLGEESFPPEAPALALLTRLREDAEHRLGGSVTDAVLAVPSDVPPEIQERLQQLATDSGWTIRRTVPRCVAAATHWLATQPPHDHRLLLVVDWGDSGLAASLLSPEPTVTAHLLTVSDTTLGAVRLRDAVVDYALRQVQQEHNVEGSAQPRFLSELQRAADRAVRELEDQDSCWLVVAGGLKGEDGAMLDVEIELNRADYEKMVSPLVSRAMALVGKTVTECGATADQLGDIVLIGSAARTPLLTQQLATWAVAAHAAPYALPEDSIALAAARMVAAPDGAPDVRHVADARAFLADRARPPEEEPAPVDQPPPPEVALTPDEATAPEVAPQAADQIEQAEPADEPSGETMAALVETGPSSPSPVASPLPEESALASPPAAEPQPDAPEPASRETPAASVDEASATRELPPPPPGPPLEAGDEVPPSAQTLPSDDADEPAELEGPAEQRDIEAPSQLVATAPSEEPPAAPEAPEEVPAAAPSVDEPAEQASELEPVVTSPEPVETELALPDLAPPPAASPATEATDQPAEPQVVAETPPVPPTTRAAGPRLYGAYREVEQASVDTHCRILRAEHVENGRVATIRHYPGDDDRAKNAFARALFARHLRHPNIEAILDFGHVDGGFFIVADAAGRVSLRDLLRERGRRKPLPIKQALEIGIGLCQALEALHRIGLFHRNIKPGNIVVEEETNRPLLGGFEIAVLLQPGHRTSSVAGTLPYMAPEAVEGRADCRADVYSAAAVLYERLTGVVPFAGRSADELKSRILTREARPPIDLNPTVPRSVSELIMRGLVKEPDRRALRADDLRRALQAGPAG